MTNKKRGLAVLIIGLIISFLFTILLAITNDILFLDKTHNQEFENILKRQSIQNNEISQLEITKNGYIEWPWYSLLYYLGIYLTYWFFVGRIFRNFFSDKRWLLSLLIPTIIGILFSDILFPSYLLCCYIGGKSNQ